MTFNYLNKFALIIIGVDHYKNISIQPLSLPKTVQLVILVITRWHDIGSRMFLRNTIGSNGQGQRHGMYLPNLSRNIVVFSRLYGKIGIISLSCQKI